MSTYSTLLKSRLRFILKGYFSAAEALQTNFIAHKGLST